MESDLPHPTLLQPRTMAQALMLENVCTLKDVHPLQPTISVDQPRLRQEGMPEASLRYLVCLSQHTLAKKCSIAPSSGVLAQQLLRIHPLGQYLVDPELMVDARLGQEWSLEQQARNLDIMEPLRCELDLLDQEWSLEQRARSLGIAEPHRCEPDPPLPAWGKVSHMATSELQVPTHTEVRAADNVHRAASGKVLAWRCNCQARTFHDMATVGVVAVVLR